MKKYFLTSLVLAVCFGCVFVNSESSDHAIAQPLRLNNVALETSDSNLQDSGPVKVEVKKTESGWRLIRGGKPFQLNGSGGAGVDGPIAMFKELGGNSTRTWGADAKSVAVLDKAKQHGITVAMGLWLEHERHGFDYNDHSQVSEQIEKTLADVNKYKNHPSILVWGLGNEMEADGSNPAIWMHIEHIAKRIKEADPNHPIMTVIAEMGGKKIESIHKYCPSIDIIGINSYGGGPSVPKRYRELGGTKPYIVTEFGPLGTWEVGKNSFGAVEEPTSTAKAAQYKSSFSAFKNDTELCLGAYAFLWGHKQEGTATWFGMLTPDGKKTAAVDLMTEYWTGNPPSNRCPQISSFKLEGSNIAKPGSTVKLSLAASDPEGDSLNVRWEVMADAASYLTGGDFQKTPPTYNDAIINSSNTSAEIKLPDVDGIVRVYAYIDDGKGAAATANLPILIEGAKPMAAESASANLPFVVFDEADTKSPYVPSGHMGSTGSIALNERSTDNPKFGTHCLKCEFKRADEWGGVVWQSPENDWGDLPGGLNLSGAKQLSFWARSGTGTEKVTFGFGIFGREKKFYDTAKKEVEVTLSKEWKQYTIDVSGSDLSRIKSSFFWSLAGQGKPIAFYLDRIVFE